MANNLYEITTDDIELPPENEQDKRCAPSISFEQGSCIRLEILIKMTEAYNAEFPDNTIELDPKIELLHPKKYKKYLVKEFADRLGEKCNTQSCWSEQNFIKRMPRIAQKELAKYTWRPNGPDDSTEWLNTTHIDEVLKQYEVKYPSFYFGGAVPRDFQDHAPYKMDESFYKKLWKSGKTKFGVVYNTDKLGSPGSHWQASYADFENGLVYFFDSYGVAPNKEVRDHLKQLENFIRKNCKEITNINRNKNNLMKCNNVKVDYNKEQHQKLGTECGVYSINFIVRMLKGEDFYAICKSKVNDHVMEKCRKIYFQKDEN